jgi:hypothetical protein
MGWNGWGVSDITWTLIMLTAGVLLSGLMSFTRSDIAYSLVLVWAFVGISVRWLDLMPLNIAGITAAGLVLLLQLLSRTLPTAKKRPVTN